MRLQLNLSPSQQILPFNYQHLLTGTLHKWLGDNILHSKPSLYSFSWLNGAKPVKNGLRLDKGGSFFISAYDEDMLKEIIKGIQKDSIALKGVSVVDIIVIEDRELLQDQQDFLAASPILIKRRVGDRDIHYTYNDAEADGLLTETLKYKLRYAGLNDKDIKVSFCAENTLSKIKVVYYKTIGNRVNICPVRIEGTYEQIAFAFNVGIGNSTGIGFGALK